VVGMSSPANAAPAMMPANLRRRVDGSLFDTMFVSPCLVLSPRFRLTPGTVAHRLAARSKSQPSGRTWIKPRRTDAERRPSVRRRDLTCADGDPHRAVRMARRPGTALVLWSAEDRADGGFVAAVAAGSDARCRRRLVDILFGREDFRHACRHLVLEGDGRTDVRDPLRAGSSTAGALGPDAMIEIDREIVRGWSRVGRSALCASLCVRRRLDAVALAGQGLARSARQAFGVVSGVTRPDSYTSTTSWARSRAWSLVMARG
jgi:hypothetical protein